MSKIITIDPVTRISGFLEINAKVENNVVVDAMTSGLLFRGFEKMLRGRPPLDAVYFTERICGICSTAHAVASTIALEDALRITPAKNDLYLRDIMHGFEFLQNHLRQFYYYTVPSYAKMPDIRPISPQSYHDFRLPPNLNDRIVKNYTKSILYSRLAHEGLAVLGGKAPHTHGIFPGGVTVNIDPYKLIKVRSIVKKIKGFAGECMMEDISTISRYYPDYFEKGISYPNLMSYGLFHYYDDPELTYVKPGLMIDNRKYLFDPSSITESILHTWYVSDESEDVHKGQPILEVDMSKRDAYTFIKAPRYEQLPMQVGPLARQILSGNYKGGYSTMDRNIARVREVVTVGGIMEKLIDKVQFAPNSQRTHSIPDEAYGSGLTDTTRGSLGHWIHIKNKVIDHYDIITPSNWNLSPRDEREFLGPVEKALVGCRIDNIDEPAELGRIVRSFDPCVSCATHILKKGMLP